MAYFLAWTLKAPKLIVPFQTGHGLDLLQRPGLQLLLSSFPLVLCQHPPPVPTVAVPSLHHNLLILSRWPPPSASLQRSAEEKPPAGASPARPSPPSCTLSPQVPSLPLSPKSEAELSSLSNPRCSQFPSCPFSPVPHSKPSSPLIQPIATSPQSAHSRKEAT